MGTLADKHLGLAPIQGLPSTARGRHAWGIMGGVAACPDDGAECVRVFVLHGGIAVARPRCRTHAVAIVPAPMNAGGRAARHV